MRINYTNRPVYIDYTIMILGAGLVAYATQCIFAPNHLVVGGFSGLAIIIQELTKGVVEGGIPLWVTNLVLNAPVFLLGWKIKGKTFIKRTLVATVAISAWLYILPETSLIQNDLFLVSVFGGLIQGVGLGMVFTMGATTGGTDMVGALIHHFRKHISLPIFMAIIDGIVILLGCFVFGIEKALYAIVAIAIGTKLSDSIIEGLKFAKSIYIISDKNDEIAKAVMEECQRGMTSIYAKGVYTGKNRDILYAVMNKKELVQVKEIVKQIDQDAFVIVNDAREVLGEGFIPIR